MTNSDFWAQIRAIISAGFTPEGLAKLDEYADRFTCGQLLYQRFSPAEQHGCIEAGYAHIVATLIAGAEAGTDSVAEGIMLSFPKRSCMSLALDETQREAFASS